MRIEQNKDPELKTPEGLRLARCNKCFYAWYTKSKSGKPTCPACHGHNTKVYPTKHFACLPSIENIER